MSARKIVPGAALAASKRGMKTSEIARFLGVSPTTVSQALSRDRAAADRAASFIPLDRMQLSTRARNCLWAEGLLTVDAITGAYLSGRLRNIPGLGEVSFLEICNELRLPAEPVGKKAAQPEQQAMQDGGHQAMWPQMIAALASIDAELGLPDNGCNSTGQTLAAIRALKVKAATAAIAQPKPEPIGEVVIGEEGVAKGWTVVKWRADLPPIAVGTKLYAAPMAPPEQQAGITIDQAQKIVRDCKALKRGELLPASLLALVRPPL